MRSKRYTMASAPGEAPARKRIPCSAQTWRPRPPCSSGGSAPTSKAGDGPADGRLRERASGWLAP